MISFKAARTGTLLFLIVGLSFTMTSALAFWREVNVTTEVEVTTIGSPVDIVINDLNDGNDTYKLVPIGRALSVGDVERIELYYNVGVSRDLLNEVTLNVTINDILIDYDGTYSHLVKITVLGQENGAEVDLFNDVITITVVIELLEPFDLDEVLSKEMDLDLVNVDNAIEAYEAINGKNISFIIGLELIKKEETE